MLVLIFIYKNKITLYLKERLGKTQPRCSALLRDTAFLTEPMKSCEVRLESHKTLWQAVLFLACWVITQPAGLRVHGVVSFSGYTLCNTLRAAFSCSLLTGKEGSVPSLLLGYGLYQIFVAIP